MKENINNFFKLSKFWILERENKEFWNFFKIKWKIKEIYKIKWNVLNHGDKKLIKIKKNT